MRGRLLLMFLAFVMLSVPALADFRDGMESPVNGSDWGDAPGYATLAVDNGASHAIVGPWLGGAAGAPDSEPDGQPHPAALGDDHNGIDDENGVLIPHLVLGMAKEVTLEVSGADAYVYGWIDWNQDGIWQDPNERVYGGWLAVGTHTFSIYVHSALLGQTYGRFRISTTGPMLPEGFAADGEVEDYEVYVLENDEYKWTSHPDLSTDGIDVVATEEFILADDFLCTEEGYITEIGIWGSWLWDEMPFDDSTAVTFFLSIHEDVPDLKKSREHTRPGDPLWLGMFEPGEFTAEVWRDSIVEGFLMPPDQYIFPADSTCWLYTFHIDQANAFYQEGTVDTPVVYWLDVQAWPENPGAFFGWKTSWEHWNEYAYWGRGDEPYPGPWDELLYPLEDKQVGQLMNLAFRIRSDADTATALTDIGNRDVAQSGFGLHQNVPNPFNPATEILYNLPAGGRVTLEVFDVEGRLVRTLVDRVQTKGSHNAVWDGRDASGQELSSGVYFYRLRAAGIDETRKMLLLK